MVVYSDWLRKFKLASWAQRECLQLLAVLVLILLFQKTSLSSFMTVVEWSVVFALGDVAGVELTSSQIADPSCELSTQQTSDYLAQFDNDWNFPEYDAEIKSFYASFST